MELKSDLVDAVLLCEGNKVFPVGDKNLVPLIVKNLKIVVRPGQVTQLGYFAPGWSPGQPEKVLI